MLELAIEAICRLPVDHEGFGDRSSVELIRRSGIRDHLESMSVARIAGCLDLHPEWIGAWFRWSEDTRGTPAWYVRANPLRPGWEVGYLDGSQVTNEEQFQDRTQACAVYVDHAVRELAELI